MTQNAESASKNVTLQDMKEMLGQRDDNKFIEYTEWQRVEVDGKEEMKIIKAEVQRRIYRQNDTRAC